MYDEASLKALVKETALAFGEFTLASGKKASYYLDCRKVTLDSRGARLIGAGMLADHTGLHLTYQLRRTGVVPLMERLANIEDRLTTLESVHYE